MNGLQWIYAHWPVTSSGKVFFFACLFTIILYQKQWILLFQARKTTPCQAMRVLNIWLHLSAFGSNFWFWRSPDLGLTHVGPDKSDRASIWCWVRTLLNTSALNHEGSLCTNCKTKTEQVFMLHTYSNSSCFLWLVPLSLAEGQLIREIHSGGEQLESETCVWLPLNIIAAEQSGLQRVM